MSANMSTILLQVDGVTCRFDGVMAVADLSFGVRAGEIKASTPEHGLADARRTLQHERSRKPVSSVEEAAKPLKLLLAADDRRSHHRPFCTAWREGSPKPSCNELRPSGRPDQPDALSPRTIATSGWLRPDRYCIDILTQIAAVSTALESSASKSWTST